MPTHSRLVASCAHLVLARLRAAASEVRTLAARPPPRMPIGHFNPVWAVGIALEAVATLACCIGKQMLRYAAISKNNSFYLVGIVFVSIIDPIFDLSAYTFAAQSIIAPCA